MHRHSSILKQRTRGRLNVEKLTYGLIGCGRIAPNHITAAMNNADALEVVALCDPVREHAEKILSFLPEEKRASVRMYEDYREMLRDGAPTLVSIATESGKHASIGLDCLDAGCNVIIEKPIALSMDDARALVSKAKEKNVKLCVNHQNRFNKAVQKIRSAVEEGRFGRMLHGTAHILWSRGEEYYAQAPWRGTWEQDGGTLMNQCIHGIDLLRWMLGDEVEEIYGATRQRFHDYLEAEDVGVAVLKFKNGAVGTVEGTSNVYPKNLEETLYVFGESGTVKVGGTSANNIDVWEFADETEADAEAKGLQEVTSNVYGNGHTALYADMVDAIDNDRAPYVDAVAGRNALEIVLAIYKSQKTGEPVKLPLRGFASTDMAGEFDDK